MPMTPQDTVDDVMKAKAQAKKAENNVSEMAQDQIEYAEDELLSFTQRKPLVALLTALVVGIVMGKLVL